MTKRRSFAPEPPRFSRQWWLDQARTLLWVLIVAVLIWIYADMEVAGKRDYRATIRLTTGPSDNKVVLSRKDIDVAFTLKGSSRGLENFESKLKSTGSVVQYDVSDFPAGESVLSTAAILEAKEAVSKAGLEIQSVSPMSFNVTLDERIVVPDIPVVFDDYTGATLLSKPVITPEKVSIRVLRSEWQKIKEVPAIKTRPVDFQKENIESGKPFVVPLQPSIAGLSVAPDPPSVKVQVQIGELTQPRQFTVTVQILAPLGWTWDNTWREYDIVTPGFETSGNRLSDFRKEITVAGPPKDLDRLRPENIQAFVILTDDDKKPGTWQERPVLVRFPDDLQLKLAGEKPVVKFKLVKRSAPPATP